MNDGAAKTTTLNCSAVPQQLITVEKTPQMQSTCPSTNISATNSSSISHQVISLQKPLQSVQQHSQSFSFPKSNSQQQPQPQPPTAPVQSQMIAVQDCIINEDGIYESNGQPPRFIDQATYNHEMLLSAIENLTDAVVKMSAKFDHIMNDKAPAARNATATGSTLTLDDHVEFQKLKTVEEVTEFDKKLQNDPNFEREVVKSDNYYWTEFVFVIEIISSFAVEQICESLRQSADQSGWIQFMLLVS